MPIVHAMLAFVVILVVLQLRLLTATMNAYREERDRSFGRRQSRARSASSECRPAAIPAADRAAEVEARNFSRLGNLSPILRPDVSNALAAIIPQSAKNQRGMTVALHRLLRPSSTNRANRRDIKGRNTMALSVFRFALFVCRVSRCGKRPIVRSGRLGRRRQAERARRSQSGPEDRRDRSDGEACRRPDRRQDRARVDL